jgi:hypothetical protein
MMLPVNIMRNLKLPVKVTVTKAVISATVILLNGCAVVTQYPTTVASTAIWGTTGKSTTDHVLSFVTGMDCVTLRIFSEYENEYICEEVVPEQKVWKVRGLDKLSKI